MQARFLYRYDGVCDKDGCDFGSWRLGDHEYYGPGSGFKIDTTKPFTVVTQFKTDDGTENGNLISVGRKYVQNGKVIENSKVYHIFVRNIIHWVGKKRTKLRYPWQIHGVFIFCVGFLRWNRSV